MPSLKVRLTSLLARVQTNLLYKNSAFLSLLGINLAFYFLGLRDALALKIEHVGTWREAVELLTYMFSHANFAHIFGNFFYIAPAALYLERRIGSKQFLKTWLLCGLGSVLFFMAVPTFVGWSGLMGASGAISGVFAYTLLTIDEHPVYRALALVVLVVVFFEQFIPALISCIVPTPIAYWAHVGGILTGIVLRAINRP